MNHGTCTVCGGSVGAVTGSGPLGYIRFCHCERAPDPKDTEMSRLRKIVHLVSITDPVDYQKWEVIVPMAEKELERP